MSELELLQFEGIEVDCPPQFIFDLPHARALNIIFCLSINMNKGNYDIGKI
jgi:hypothetical protein